MTETATEDTFNLQRFVDAQARCYERVRDELRRGHKTSHWMWFVFPQLRGLGRSTTAQTYAIASLDEAQAYLTHAVLGHRLVECTEIVNALEGRTLRQIFDAPDDLKFRSSMTLFAIAAPDADVFWSALDKYCDGAADLSTLKLLGITDLD